MGDGGLRITWSFICSAGDYNVAEKMGDMLWPDYTVKEILQFLFLRKIKASQLVRTPLH